jgi:hypothetical protein
MQDFFGALQSRATTRSRAVQKLANDLFVYQKARAALNGPALADWTASYEENLRQLIALAVDSINDVFDSGSWPTAIKMLSEEPTSENAEDLMKRVQSVVATDFGEQAAASIEALTKLLANTTISTAPSSDSVRITFSRDGQQLIAFGLSAQRATGDVARKSSAAILAGRPRLTVERSNGLRQPIASSGGDLGVIDFYGAFLEVCSWLLGNARCEMRASQRYGRVRVQGEVPLLIALAVWAVIVGALWGSYALACTGAIISSNAPNEQSSACQILKGIATFISVFGIFVVIALGTASNNFTTPAVDGVNFNLN